MSDETQGAAPTSEPQGQGTAPAGAAPTAQDAAQQLGAMELSEADLDRVVTVKVDGQPQRLKVRDVLSEYSLRTTSHKRLEEAAKLRKEADSDKAQVKQLVELLRDPDGMVAVAEQMGISLAALRDRIERELSTPDDVKRMRSIEQREKAIEARERAEREAREKARMDAETRQWVERERKEMTGAIEAAGLPKTPQVMGMIAKVKLAALDAGVTLTASEAAETVREELRALVGGVVSASEPDALRSLLGDKLEAVRKSEVERAVAGRNAALPAVSKKRTQPNPNPPPRKLSALMSPEEYSRYLDEQMKGRG